ncbi:PucR family transcriptional regulator ligand-binding domain-containing protein [Herbiconiux moechotypicola]|uniref:PucR family transcriptional regulator n=1 Tax=Herbiconiux moechotypicola TaxID=637393 RepID=A0ABP5R123_9MICO|nr:PucR family transcriptional regulator [Herbiconiux moechotypicola]MCS5731399.1 PucR family transcriptional regulator ligand-binding domain-containing protein [Herbiconiux moechotypicola]
MPVSIDELLAETRLALTLLAPAGPGEPAVVDWSHSSDLDDPTPFLEPGQLLLTTGRQFTGLAPGDLRPYSAYVARLTGAGVVALGFGTEVVRDGTPDELVRACLDAGLALLEVPYATPFIAVSRFIADRVAAEGRARLQDALDAQEAVSSAVLSAGGLAAAVRSASQRLGARIGVLDSDGTVLEGRAGEAVRARAIALIMRGRRARDSGAESDRWWSAQTLGGAGRLSGALVVERETPFDPLETSVVTVLAALTELALEHDDDRRLALRAIAPQLLAVLRQRGTAGVDAVRSALEHHGVGLPEEPFRVLAARVDDLPAGELDALERLGISPHRRLLVVVEGDRLLVLSDHGGSDEVAARLAAGGVPAGGSDPAGWNRLGEALTEAVTALEAAQEPGVLGFHELSSASVFGLLTATGVAELARRRLNPVRQTPEGPDRLREAGVWLEHQGAWDPASRELGLHRHTLKQHMTELAAATGLDLDGFGGRAELWALLRASEADRNISPPAALH